jgi:acetylornithine deacetylase/succinyl-diaminopimelate desuccinylase family protein
MSDAHDRTLAEVDALGDELIAGVRELVAIRSINPAYPGGDYSDHLGDEGRASRALGARYAEAGCEVDVFGLEPGRENAVGVLRGSGGGRSLLFNGHVDVVPPGPAEDWRHDPWGGEVADGRMWGRGSCDMKGGLAAQAYAAIALRRAGVRLAGDLLLTAVVGEETMAHELGTTACVARGYRADAAVVAEPSAPPLPLAVVAATPGVLRFIVRVRGRRTHPGMRAETIRAGGGGWAVGVNAIDKAVLIHEALRRREEEWGLTRSHPLFRPGQFVIQPGVFVGSPAGQLDPFFIPDAAMIDYIVIHHPDASLDEVRDEIADVVATAARLDGWLREHPPEIEWKHHWPPSVVDPGAPIVAATLEAHRRASGTESAAVGWTAVHDGAFLNAAGIPAIAYGPGDVRAAHAPDEHVAVDELLAAARTYATLALLWCGEG